jgi:hypothetical protein
VAPAAIVVGYVDAAAASPGLWDVPGTSGRRSEVGGTLVVVWGKARRRDVAGMTLGTADGASLGTVLGAADGVALRAVGLDDADAGAGDVTTWAATPIPATSASANPAATVGRGDSRPRHVLPPITTPSRFPTDHQAKESGTARISLVVPITRHCAHTC